MLSSAVSAQDNGVIAGTLVDTETGEVLIGANVVIRDTTTGTTTDLDGHYRIINLPSGDYVLVFSYIGYNPTTVSDIRVVAGATTTIDVGLHSEAINVGEVTVEARALRNNEATLLRSRQRALAVSDAISAETIGRSGSSSAADAMKKVTGVAVVGGKYVYVRGLGDRYTNTQLNGAVLPSADPDRNAVALDLFPAALIDNIVTTKTFTPDQPGDFTGGSVNISTRDFPDRFTFSVSSSLSYSSNVGVGGDYLFYRGGKIGTLGDNPTNGGIPNALRDPNVVIPSLGESFTDPAKAARLDALSKSFDTTMTPALFAAPVNKSYSVSIGDNIPLFGRQLGVIGGMSYGRHRFGYTSGKTARYQLTGDVNTVEGLNEDFRLLDQKGTEEVLLGGLVNVSYKLHPRHEVGFNYVFSRSAESSARFQFGSFPRDLRPDAIYETRVLQFVERSLSSFQAHGEHAIGRSLLKWNTTRARSTQDEPDLRYFTDNYTIAERGGRIDTLYSVQASIYPVPTRYFRNMAEDSWNSNVSLTVPVGVSNGMRANVKVGGSRLKKTRAFSERRFEFRTDSGTARYAGNPGAFFGLDNVGILASQSTDSFFRFGNYVVDATQLSSNYDGDQTIGALFAMIELPVTRKLRVITGVRYESTRMDVASRDSSLAAGRLRNHDWLPSANFIYGLTDRMNLRFSFGRTVARPIFRELAPYASFNFVGDYVFVGNPALKRSLINSFDLRWEWFMNPGEIVAVSGFLKTFRDPIERAINPLAGNPEIQLRNIGKASVRGLEFEARKNLGWVHGVLRRLDLGGNVSLVHSRVDIAEDELGLIRAFDPNASSSRPLMGQSGYTINADITYQHPASGTAVSIYYNVFGRRLDKVSIGGTPDIYEQPQNMVDFTLKQRIWSNLTFNVVIKNAMNARYQLSHTFKGQSYVTSEHKLGRSYSIGLRLGT